MTKTSRYARPESRDTLRNAGTSPGTAGTAPGPAGTAPGSVRIYLGATPGSGRRSEAPGEPEKFLLHLGRLAYFGERVKQLRQNDPELVINAVVTTTPE